MWAIEMMRNTLQKIKIFLREKGYWLFYYFVITALGLLVWGQEILKEKNAKLLWENQQLILDLMKSKIQLLSKEAAMSQIKLKYQQSSTLWGQLSFIYDNQVKVEYLGQVIHGKANGYGWGIFETRGIYQGYWKNNLRHGKGKHTWKNGDVYEGDFFNGHKNGQGIYYFSDGSKFVGNWKDNLRDGLGTYYTAEGNIKFQGLWQKDKFIE